MLRTHRLRKKPLTTKPDGPKRTCVGCRRTSAVDSLRRIARTADGELIEQRSAPGRGAWLCAATTVACFEAAAAKRAFARAFRQPVSDEALEPLRRSLRGADGDGLSAC